MHLGEGDNRIVRIILISVGIVTFITLIVSSYQIMSSNSPDVLNNCIKKAVLLKNGSEKVASKEGGMALLFDSLKENGTFIANTFEVCDIEYAGYVFSAAGNKSYVVCGDGKIYVYIDSCASGGQAQSFISMLIANKSAAEIK